MEAGARYCQHCGARAPAPAPGDGTADETKLRDAALEFARGTVREARALGKEALQSDIGRKVAAGAALGAAAGVVIPVIGPAIGATLGAGYVAFKRLAR